MASDLVKDVGAADFDSEVLKSPVPVIVDFWAEWCGPCRMLAPLLDEIAKEKQGQLKIVKVNVDKQTSLAAKYGIQSIPALFFFKGGEVAGKHVGLASKRDLITKFEAIA